MAKIRLVKKKTNEMSGTGGSASATPGTGAQYASPKAFPKVASDYNKHSVHMLHQFQIVLQRLLLIRNYGR
jgi:hypothetical protein